MSKRYYVENTFFSSVFVYDIFIYTFIELFVHLKHLTPHTVQS